MSSVEIMLAVFCVALVLAHVIRMVEVVRLRRELRKAEVLSDGILSDLKVEREKRFAYAQEIDRVQGWCIRLETAVCAMMGIEPESLERIKEGGQ